MVILPNLGCLLGIIIAISGRKGDGELNCLKSMGQPLNAPWQSATFYQLEVSILHGSDQGPVIDFLLHDLPWLIKTLAKSSTTWVTLSHLRLEFALELKCMSYVEKQNTHTCLSGDGLRFQFYIQGGELGPNFTSQRCSEKMEPGSGMEPDYQDTSQNRRWINSQKIGFL